MTVRSGCRATQHPHESERRPSSLPRRDRPATACSRSASNAILHGRPCRPADRPKVTYAGESRRTARASAHTRTADPSPRATWPCRSADLRTTVAPTFRPKSSAVAAGAPPPTADRESLGIDPRLAGRRRERSRPGACQTDWENVGPAGPRGVRHHSVQAAPAVDDVGVDDQLDTQGRPLPPRDVAAIGT